MRALRRERRPRPVGPVKTVLHKAEELHQMMRERDWTQAQLAGHLGISRAAVCQALRPLRLHPTVKAAIHLRAQSGSRVPRSLINQLHNMCTSEALAALQR